MSSKRNRPSGPYKIMPIPVPVYRPRPEDQDVTSKLQECVKRGGPFPRAERRGFCTRCGYNFAMHYRHRAAIEEARNA